MTKKTIILGIAALLAVAIVCVLIFASTKPDLFEVRRSAAIKAPPAKIFPLINEFDRWAAWSPYEKKDPAMKRTRSGPPSGTGAVYEWDGDKNVGKGRMEILDTVPPSKIHIKLDFVQPFEAHNLVEFTMQPQGDTTLVTWDMQGPTPFIGKVMHVFFDMDRMVGADFEVGLANLKALAEK